MAASTISTVTAAASMTSGAFTKLCIMSLCRAREKKSLGGSRLRGNRHFAPPAAREISVRRRGSMKL